MLRTKGQLPTLKFVPLGLGYAQRGGARPPPRPQAGMVRPGGGSLSCSMLSLILSHHKWPHPRMLGAGVSDAALRPKPQVRPTAAVQGVNAPPAPSGPLPGSRPRRRRGLDLEVRGPCLGLQRSTVGMAVLDDGVDEAGLALGARQAPRVLTVTRGVRESL